MELRDDTTIYAIMEHLIANGATGMARVFGQLFEMAMRIEREQHLKAAHYERTTERLGYANGYKPSVRHFQEAAGRYGDQQIGSISHRRACGSEP